MTRKESKSLVESALISRYQWTSAPVPFTPKGALWIVIVGCSFTAPVSGNNVLIAVSDAQGTSLDKAELDFVSASGSAFWALPRKMLVPPGGTVSTSITNVVISFIQCASLEDALAIL